MPTHAGPDRLFKDRRERGVDGSVRKAHYGDGEQPWDAMVRLGLADRFAAGSILKYLRRSGKDPAHSLESARWYWARLKERAFSGHGDAEAVVASLLAELTFAEASLLEVSYAPAL